ncbi:MAG: Zn-ribbon domain-containing OB-fold protein [Thermoplasmata archaeon]
MTFFEKQTNPLDPVHYRGNLQVDNLYTSGAAGNRFFKHLMKNDTFLASECKECGTVFFPPRLYCEDCFVEIPEENWFEVPAAGTVRLFTRAKLNTYGERLEEPKIMALIDIEDTDGAHLGVIKSDEPDKDFIGCKVKAVLRPKDEREGTLKDILYFQEE